MLGSMTTLVGLALLAQAPDISVDFRNSWNAEKVFRPERPDEAHFFVPEPGGMHVKLDGQTNQPVGLLAGFALEDDFDATLAYEILSGGRGNKNWGPGVQLYLMLRGPTRDGITIARQFRAHGDFFIFGHMVDEQTDKGPKRVSKQSREAPADKARLTGKLRVARQGTDLVASFAEGDETAFREIGKFPIGEEQVSMFRIAADPSAKQPIDVRFLDLKVTSKAPAPRPTPAAVDPPRSSSRLWWAAAIVVLLAAAAGGALIFRRRSVSPIASEPPQGGPQTAASSVPKTPRKPTGRG